MRKIFLMLVLGLIFSTANAQIGVADSLINDVFTVKVNGDIQKALPKNCCYADKNSAGNVAIKTVGTDKFVVSYQAPSLYSINSQTSSVADTVINRLQIIMTKLQSTLKSK